MKETSPKENRLFIFCAMLIYACAWYMAATRGLNCTLEGESGMTAREFLRTGDWAVNHMNSMPDYDKPSFFYWLIALASLFTGKVNELAVRIPSLISSAVVMGMFSLYTWPGKINSKGLALSSALTAFVFISSPKVFWMTQMGRIDMTLNMLCFATITSFCLYRKERAPNTKKRAAYWSFFTASALAVLIKGPVGMLVTWPPIFLFLFFRKNWHELKRIFIGWGIVLFLVLTLPWYINACISTDWEFFRHFFLKESVSRFGNLFKGLEYKEFNHSPIGIYFVYFFTGFFPWSILFPAALWIFLKKKGAESWQRLYVPDDIFLILVCYAGWVFLFFSLCGVKRSDYILPLYPAAAILTAEFIKRMIEADADGLKAFLQKYCGFFSYFLCAMLVLSYTAVTVLSISKLHILLETFLPRLFGTHLSWFSLHLSENLFFMALSGAVLYGAYKVSKNDRVSNSPLLKNLKVLALMITATWVIAGGTVLPFIYHCKSMTAWCRKIDVIIKDAPLYSYKFWDEECAFYLDRPVIQKVQKERLKKLLKQKDRRIFVIARGKEIKKLEKAGIEIPWALQPEPGAGRPLYLLSNMENAPK